MASGCRTGQQGPREPLLPGETVAVTLWEVLGQRPGMLLKHTAHRTASHNGEWAHKASGADGEALCFQSTQGWN